MFLEHAKITLIAGEALAARRRVKIVGATVEYADAADICIGVTEYAAAEDAEVAVRLKNAGGSFEVEAAGAIAVGADCKGDADGKVVTGALANTAEGDEAVAIEAATTVAGGDRIEVIFKSDKMTTGA